MQNLSEAKKNEIYKVCDFDANLSSKILRRLCDLGITKGQKVVVRSLSLLKKALLIEVRGYMLSIRSQIAKGVIVEKED